MKNSQSSFGFRKRLGSSARRETVARTPAPWTRVTFGDCVFPLHGRAHKDVRRLLVRAATNAPRWCLSGGRHGGCAVGLVVCIETR